MRKWMRRVALLVVVAILLIFSWAGYIYCLSKTRQPGLDRTVVHKSLSAPVDLVRDDYGVPHITAATEPDAWFALGYAMGQDRLFQMELLRRLACGELSDILGRLALPVDRLVRGFGLRAGAERFVAENGPKHPEVMALATAFCTGINHAMETEPCPFEFTALGIPFRPFTPADGLAVAAILPITFADGIREDPMASMIKARRPDIDIDTIFPAYDKEVPITIMESLEEAIAFARERDAKNGRADRNVRPTLDEGAPISVAAAAALEELLAPLAMISHRFGPQLGSNSWVVSGKRTASGKPILANDPHISFTNPGVWYEAHITVGDFDLYGHFLPLIPVALLGHNRRFAWGITMFSNDDTDLYVETFNPDNPKQVQYKGEWVNVEERTEHIAVRWWPDQESIVRVTPHGPVITDLLKTMLDYDGPDVSLQWTWQKVEYTDIQAFFQMAHARSLDEFQAGVALITSPGLNISYADAEGNIAWWAAGKIAVRPPHVDGKTLLDGASGKDELVGLLPFEQNPHLINPDWGYIVTANNMSTFKPVGGSKLQGYWQPGDRAARIEQILDEHTAPWTLEAMQPAPFDDVAWAAGPILDTALPLLEAESAQLSPVARAACATLAKWDRHCAVDSPGAAIYAVFCQKALREILLDDLGERAMYMYVTLGDHWTFFKYAVQHPELPLWDDVTTPAVETRDQILARAFEKTAGALEKIMGSNPELWRWGQIHTIDFRHPFGYLPLIGGYFNVGPFPCPGGMEIVNNMLYHELDELPFEVVTGPSTRRLIDFGDPEHSLTVLPTGNSGILSSPHYRDQATLYMSGGYREPNLTPESIAAHAEHRMRFVNGR